MARETQVYFVRCPVNGFVKIGRARCAIKRLAEIRTMSPVPIELVGIMLCPNQGALEKELHARFAEHRAHGEWFKPASALLDFIRDNARSPRPRRKLTLVERAERNRLRRDRRALAAKAGAEAALDAELTAWAKSRGYDDAVAG